METNELLKLLSQQWCSLNDLMKICKCGKNKGEKKQPEILINLHMFGNLRHVW